MAVPFMLGNFTGGLFTGAQSTLSLYGAYQGIQQTQAYLDAGEQYKQDQEKAKAIEAAGPPSYMPARHYDRATGEWQLVQDQPPAAATPPADKPPAATPASSTTKGPVSPNPTNMRLPGEPEAGSTDPYRARVETGLPSPPPIPSPSPNDVSGPSVPPPAPEWGTRPIPVPYGTVGPDPVTLPAPRQFPTPMYPPAPFNAAGMPGPAGSQSGAGISPARIAPPSPPSVTAPVTEPIPSRQPGPPYIPPPQQAPAAPAAAPAPVPAPPYNAAGAIGGAGTQSGAAPVPPLPQGGPTVLPPGGGNEPTKGGIPQASLGRSIWNAIVPPAEASGAPPGFAPRPGVPASAPAAPAAPAAALSPAQTETQPAAPAAPAPAAATPPATGLTTASPPHTATPPAPSPAPVPVAGHPGEVQSQSTPPVLGPGVSPGAYFRASPEWRAMADEVAAAHGGGGAITAHDIAAVAEAESNWDPKADASKRNPKETGKGLMQIEDRTWNEVLNSVPGLEATIGHKLDPWNARDNMIVGTEYMKLLANHYGYGAGTTQMHVAYMRGPPGIARIKQIGWDAYVKEEPLVQQRVDKLYDKRYQPDDAAFPGGGTYNATDIINAAHGPEHIDGALNVIATSGPAGLGMTDRFRATQSALEYAAIINGRLDALPMIQDWIGQISHQGAIANTIAADQALLSGDMQGAANALARAHAFAPDGAYARIGPDRSGKLWAETFSERSGTKLSEIHITHELLAEQIVGMQNYSNYAQAIQKYRLGNAQIDLTKNHSQYYADMPKEREEAAKLRYQQGMANVQQHKDAAEAADLTRRVAIQQHQDAADAATGGLTKPIDAYITKHFGEDAPEPPLDPETKKPIMSQGDYSNMAEVQRDLMYPERVGGAGMTVIKASELAQGLMTGKLGPQKQTNAQGQEGYGLYDKTTGRVRGWVSLETVGRMMRVPGLSQMFQPPAASPAAPAVGGGAQHHTSAGPIGAGVGSYAALQGGYNQNLAGITPVPLPQRQPQQTMVA